MGNGVNPDRELQLASTVARRLGASPSPASLPCPSLKRRERRAPDRTASFSSLQSRQDPRAEEPGRTRGGRLERSRPRVVGFQGPDGGPDPKILGGLQRVAGMRG